MQGVRLALKPEGSEGVVMWLSGAEHSRQMGQRVQREHEHLVCSRNNQEISVARAKQVRGKMEEARSKDRRPDPIETMALDRTLAFTWGRWYEPGELGFVL